MKYVLYHKNCADGFTAAWVAWKWFAGECGLRWWLGGQVNDHDYSGDMPLEEIKSPDVFFIPVQYGEKLLDRMIHPDSEDEVYFVDFCPEFAEMTEIVNRAKRLVVLDHHQSREVDLLDFAAWVQDADQIRDDDGALTVKGKIGKCEVELCYRTEDAGARMAWDFWFPESVVPELVEYVEDRDLWRWELEDSMAVNAFIRNHEYEFEVWEHLARVLEDRRDSTVADLGYFALKRDEILVEQLIQAPVWVGFGDMTGPAVCAPVLQSEVGHALLERWPEAAFAACWRDQVSPDGDGTWERVWSLRARTGDAVDVSEIAKGFGGGGHRCAAGFRERGLWPDGRLKGSGKAPEGAEAG